MLCLHSFHTRSQWSGASVTLVEDGPEETQNIIRISGTPEQAERAQSLLQGFILSSKFLSCQTKYLISLICKTDLCSFFGAVQEDGP